MSHILIVFMLYGNGSAFSMQEFDDRSACIAAGDALQRGLAPESATSPKFSFICMPKGSK